MQCWKDGLFVHNFELISMKFKSDYAADLNDEQGTLSLALRTLGPQNVFVSFGRHGYGSARLHCCW